MAKLNITNVSKSFANTKILEDINITANDGEFIVLVGPSGSGKSTILRLIAGLENPDCGEISVNGTVINNLSPKDRDIAMVFQNYALYPHMTVYDNLAFPLNMKKTDKKLVEKTVNETAEMLGIKHYLTKKPKELSGGERQRVALGRAIIRKPKLFLMDEPLSNLDAKLRTQMRAELLKLHKSLSTTVIYVTHDQIEALTMGNKIVVLNKGKIQQIGTPRDVYNNPANVFVGGFVGSPAMNFFNLKVLDTSKIEFLDNVYNISIKGAGNLTKKDLLLGIRPENIAIGKKFELAFTAHVELIEMLGNEYLVYATTKSKNGKINFSVKLSEKPAFERNNFEVSINPDKIHLFDAQSLGRIDL